jgi:serine/threonine protein kinase
MVDVGASAQLRPGVVLIGKYEIVRTIGRGGFGHVYEARHLGLGTGVAVKVLNAEGRQNPKTVARFQQEAWTAARAAGAHVVRVTDIDVLQDGTPFLVMELLVGRDLERELKSRGRIPSREAVDYLLEAAAGLRDAHRQGIIHRDLKTSNLFLVDDPSGRHIKVLDFGLSKIAASLGMTSTNAMLGTPSYSAPEQLRSAKSADARADIWSLGVIAYQLLSGRLPFQGSAVADLFVQIVGAEPPDLGRIAPDVPAGLCQIVARCLEKKPERRFQSMDALAAALAPFGSPNLVAAAGSVRHPNAPAVEPGPSSTFLDSSQDTPPERRTSRLWTGVALAVVAVLITLAAGVRFGSHLLAPSSGARAPAAAVPVTVPAVPATPGEATARPAVATPTPSASARTATAETATAETATASGPVPQSPRPATRVPSRRAPANAPAKKSGTSKDLGF